MKTNFYGATAKNSSITASWQTVPSQHGLIPLIMLISLLMLAKPAWALTTAQRISLMEQYVVDLKNRMATLESNNTKLAKEVADLKNSNLAITNNINAMNQKIGNLTTANATLASNLATVASSNLGLSTRVSVLETENTALKNQANPLLTSLSLEKMNSVLALREKMLLQPNGDVLLKGVNAQIVNSEGRTDNINDKGNLIPSYNEYFGFRDLGNFPQGVCEKTGNGAIWVHEAKINGSQNQVIGINPY